MSLNPVIPQNLFFLIVYMCKSNSRFDTIPGCRSLFHILHHGGEWMGHIVCIRGIILLFTLYLVCISHSHLTIWKLHVLLFVSFLLLPLYLLLLPYVDRCFFFCSCNNSHCSLMTVAPPTESIGLSHGLYMLNIIVLLISLHSSVMNVHLPRPEESSP